MPNSEPEGDFATIPLSDLFLSDSNVRRSDIIADVDDLAKSIEKHGLLQPIVVRPENGKYRIVVGQRRYLAYKQLGRDSIQAMVVAPDKPLAEAIISFSENIQRRDLAPRDKADAIAYLLSELGSVKAVAEELSISERTVRKWVGYAAVPSELREMVDEGKLTRGQASRLWATFEDTVQAVAIGELIGESGPVKETRERLFAAAEELPDQPISVIQKRADELKHQLHVEFILPELWTRAIKRAADEYEKEPSDIARDATIEWLQEHELFADR